MEDEKSSEMPICYLAMYLTLDRPGAFDEMGLAPHKREILSIAARIGDQKFCRWIMPRGEISPAITRQTLVIKRQGKLVNKERIAVFQRKTDHLAQIMGKIEK